VVVLMSMEKKSDEEAKEEANISIGTQSESL
jgi:hypothetical protein